MGDWDRILDEATEEERLRLAMQARQRRILASSRQRMAVVSGEAPPAEAQKPQEEQKPQEAEKPAEEKSEAKLRPLANRRRRVMQQKAQEAVEAEPEAEAAVTTTAAAEASAEKENEQATTPAATAGEAPATAAAESETKEEQPFATALLTSIPTPTITSEEELAARPLLRRRLVTSRGGSQSREDLAAAAANSAAASASSSSSSATPAVVLPEEAKPKLVFFTAGRALRMVLLVVCALLGGLSGAIGSYRTQGARELILQHHGHVVSRGHDPFGELPIRGQLQRYRDMLSQPSRKVGLMNDPDVHGRHTHAVDEFEVHTAFESAEAAMPVSGVAWSALTAAPAIVVAIAAWIASNFALKPTLDKVLPPDARVASSSGILSIATSFLGGLNDYLAAGRAVLEHAAVFAFSAVVGGAATECVLRSS